MTTIRLVRQLWVLISLIFLVSNARALLYNPTAVGNEKQKTPVLLSPIPYYETLPIVPDYYDAVREENQRDGRSNSIREHATLTLTTEQRKEISEPRNTFTLSSSAARMSSASNSEREVMIPDDNDGLTSQYENVTNSKVESKGLRSGDKQIPEMQSAPESLNKQSQHWLISSEQPSGLHLSDYVDEMREKDVSWAKFLQQKHSKPYYDAIPLQEPIGIIQTSSNKQIDNDEELPTLIYHSGTNSKQQARFLNAQKSLETIKILTPNIDTGKVETKHLKTHLVDNETIEPSKRKNTNENVSADITSEQDNDTIRETFELPRPNVAVRFFQRT